jgi:hypothetical protein
LGSLDRLEQRRKIRNLLLQIVAQLDSRHEEIQIWALLVYGGFGAGGLFIVDPTLLFVQPIRGGIRVRQTKSPSTYSGYF